MKDENMKRLVVLTSKEYIAFYMICILGCAAHVGVVYFMNVPELHGLISQHLTKEMWPLVNHQLEVIVIALRVWSIAFLIACAFLIRISLNVSKLTKDRMGNTVGGGGTDHRE